MKWGVRRTPEQLGHHKIQKGTKMYRVSAESKRDITGATYVTYLPPDRDLYRGSYSKVLQKNQTGGTNAKMKETEYELTEDLDIPSRDELRKAYANAMSNEKIKKAACQALANQLVQSDEYDYRLNYGKDYKKMMDKDTKYFLEEYLKQFGSYTPDQAFALTARSLGSANPIVKQAVISQLKAKGYNAMVDEAGVGGVVSPREGVEPLILFDGAKSMKEVSVKDIDAKTMQEADKQYQKWRRVAASNRSKPW